MRNYAILSLAVLVLANCGTSPVDEDDDLCGNLIVDPGEACDGMTTASCQDMGANAGFPRCTATCEVSYDTCETLTPIDIDHHREVSCAITQERGLDCWGNNLGGAAEEPRFAPLSDITACGLGSWCGLTDAGEILCRNHGGAVPQGNGYRKLGCESSRVWAVSQTGELVGFDETTRARLDHVDGTQVRDLHVALGCAVYHDGSVHCHDTDRQALLADWEVSQLAAARRQDDLLLCGVTPNGDVQCTGEGDVVPPPIPLGDNAAVRVFPIASFDNFHVCILDSAGHFLCDDTTPLLSSPPTGSTWRDIVVDGIRCLDEACGVEVVGIDTDQHLHVFGGIRPSHEWPEPFTQIARGRGPLTAVLESGHVLSVAWNQDPDTQEIYFDESREAIEPNFVQVMIADQYRACALDSDGNIVCWGDDPPSYIPRNLSPATEITLTRSNLCARQSDDTFACSDSFRAPPGDLALRQVSAKAFDCFYGVDYDGNLHHWGQYAEALCPLFEGTYRKFDARMSTHCGLRTDGDIECWHLADPNQDPYDDSIHFSLPGPWQDMTVGLAKLCATRDSGYVECFVLGPGPDEMTPIEHEHIPRTPVDRIRGTGPFYALKGTAAPHAFGVYMTAPLEQNLPPIYLSPWQRRGSQMLTTNPSSRGDTLCLLGADNQIRCDRGAPAWPAPGALAMWRSDYHTCYRDTTQTTYCNNRVSPGEPLDFTSTNPGPLISAGDGTFCSIDTNDNYDCFPHKQPMAFAHIPELPGDGELRGGEAGYCFAPADDVAYCFNANAKVDYPLASGLRIIDPGHNAPKAPDSNETWLLCGLSYEGQLSCASSPVDIQVPRELPTDPFVDIQVEGWHACATRQSGQVACFGRYESAAIWWVPGAREESTQLSPLRADEQLHVGSQTTCLFTPGGDDLRCWGRYAH